MLMFEIAAFVLGFFLKDIVFAVWCWVEDFFTQGRKAEKHG
jgi:hypothetical protein